MSLQQISPGGLGSPISPSSGHDDDVSSAPIIPAMMFGAGTFLAPSSSAQTAPVPTTTGDADVRALLTGGVTRAVPVYATALNARTEWSMGPSWVLKRRVAGFVATVPHLGLRPEMRSIYPSQGSYLSGPVFRDVCKVGVSGVSRPLPALIEVAKLGPLQEPPLTSVIWTLVERQQVRTARSMLGQLPNEPQYQRIKALLRPPTTSTSPRRDGDRSAEYQWLRQHAAEHAGKWVAVAGNTLIGSAATLRDLRRQMRSIPSTTSPLLYYVQ